MMIVIPKGLGHDDSYTKGVTFNYNTSLQKVFSENIR